MTTRRTSQPLPSGPYPRLTALPDPPKPPDAMQQRRHIARADQVLRAFYSDRPDVLVSGEGYLCREPGEARRSPHPDCLVAFDVPFPPEMIEDEANGYVISEIGQPPDFVLEIASETTARRDETVKREIYASLLVKEYWRFDASGGRHYRAPLAGMPKSVLHTSRPRARMPKSAYVGWRPNCAGGRRRSKQATAKPFANRLSAIPTMPVVPGPPLAAAAV